MIVGQPVIRIVLELILQGLSRVTGVTAAELNLSAVDQAFTVVGIAGENSIIQLAGFVQAVFQDEQLNVILLDLQIFGMVVIDGAVFGSGFVEIAGGEV